MIFESENVIYFRIIFGNSQNIYFYQDNDDIFISNQLKNILSKKKQRWSLNRQAVNEFLDKGYIPSKKTLVNNIYKLPSKKYIEMDLKKQKARIKSDSNLKKIRKINVDKKNYNQTLMEICKSCEKEFDDNVAMTISSGFDTNYLLYSLHNISNKKIEAFCIGGKVGRNEIADAKKICSQYNNVDFYSKLVDENSLCKYPEIIWALEGAIYESGVFLQYELAKMINEHNIDNIILGECADQVLHYELYYKKLALLKKVKYNIYRNIVMKFKGIVCKPYRDIYNMASYKVIKKNGIMMNYFGIDPLYPYLRKKFIENARNIVKKGDIQKLYHKEVINYYLPESITRILKKIGGATELKTLFIGNIKLDDIKNICKRSEYYREKKFNDEFYEIDYFMKLLYIEIFRKIFMQGNIDKYVENRFWNYDLTYFFPELKKKIDGEFYK